MRLTGWTSLSKGTRFQVLFYSGALGFGVLMFIGPRWGKAEEWENVLTGIGIALVASSVLGFAQRLFFYDDFRSEMDSLVQGSLKNFLGKDMMPFINEGVERLYVNREAAIRDFSSHVQLEREKIVIIGSSLKGLLDRTERNTAKKAFADMIREKIKSGVAVEFLLTHPALAFLREDAEGRMQKAIKDEIIETLEYLTGVNFAVTGSAPINVPFDNIRLYHGTPTIFSLIVSDRMLINPYAYQATAYESFCFEISKKSEQGLYDKLENAHFRKPWDNKLTTTSLTKHVMTNIRGFCLEDLFPARRGDLVHDPKPATPNRPAPGRGNSPAPQPHGIAAPAP